MFGEWKVQIIDTPGYMLRRVYLVQHTKAGSLFLTKGGKEQVLHVEGVYKDDPYFAEMTDDQLQAFADTLQAKGIKTVNDSKNEGLLEATKAHLEDMRTLVFKRSK